MVALLGLEPAVVLALRVIDAIVVHDGVLSRLRPGASAQAVFGSVHLSLHQIALGNH